MVAEIVAGVDAAAALDAGCGEGETLDRLSDLLPADLHAVDVSPTAVEHTRRRAPDVEAQVASLYELPYPDGRFGLLLCLEVLEHLDRPADAVGELARVCSGDIVISVPHEPWFRAGSLLRGKYVRHLGNHPEHIQQFGPASLRGLLEPKLEVIEIRRAFPWLIAHCRTRRPAAEPRPPERR